jgi:hypothetical protein
MSAERGPREPIYELTKKIQFLMEHPVLRKQWGHNNNLASFCDKTGLSRPALREVLEKGLEKMSGWVQAELATACRFGVDWVEWNDPSAREKTPRESRQDTAEAFERRWLQEEAASAAGRPHEPRQTGVPGRTDAPRRTGVPLRVTRPSAAVEFRPYLASIDLQASQCGPGEPQPVSVDLICRPAPVEGIMIAVKRGWLAIDCGRARAADLKGRAGYPNGADFSREACKIVLWPDGTSQRPVWEVIADPGPIGLLPLPHDFCKVYGLAPGDIVKVSFTVYIKDLDLVEPPDEEDPATREDSFSFMRDDFKKLGRAKQKILKRLAEMKLPEEVSGRVQLCSDAVQFEEIGIAGDNHDNDGENEQ